MLGKHASRQRDRGFESHPLRHQAEPCKIEKACELEWPSRTDAVGFERGGSRGDTPLRGETRGGRPPQWERDFECPPSPPSKMPRKVEGTCDQSSPRQSRQWTSYCNCNGAGPCATEPCEPRQVRKEATVSGSFCVPQDHLAPLSLMTSLATRHS